MRRSWPFALALVTAVAVRDAAAQSPAPAVGLGLDVAATITSDHSVHRGPRLVVHFTGRDALQVTATLQRLAPLEDFAQVETDLYLASYRRLLHTTGPVRVFGTLGGGLQRTLIVTPPITFGNPPVTFPSTRGSEILPAFTTGAGIDVRLASRAALVIESSFVLSDKFGGRVSAGLVVPLRAYPSPTPRLDASVPWATLDAGERAWV